MYMFLRSQIILDIFIWMPLPMLKVSKQNAVHCKSKLLSLFLKIIFRTFSNRCFKCFSFSLPFIHCLSAYPLEHLEVQHIIICWQVWWDTVIKANFDLSKKHTLELNEQLKPFKQTIQLRSIKCTDYVSWLKKQNKKLHSTSNWVLFWR